LSARKIFEIESNKGDINCKAQLGQTLRLMGQFDGAIKTLTSVVSSFPEDSRAWNELGLSYLQNGNNEEAQQAFEKSLAINPTDGSAHYNLMHAYSRQRKLTQSRREDTIFRAMQEEEPLRSIRDQYLLKHPELSCELEPLHVHYLTSPTRQHSQ